MGLKTREAQGYHHHLETSHNRTPLRGFRQTWPFIGIGFGLILVHRLDARYGLLYSHPKRFITSTGQ